MALGANTWGVMRMVLLLGLRIATMGLTAGMLLMAASAPLFSG